MLGSGFLDGASSKLVSGPNAACHSPRHPLAGGCGAETLTNVGPHVRCHILKCTMQARGSAVSYLLTPKLWHPTAGWVPPLAPESYNKLVNVGLLVSFNIITISAKGLLSFCSDNIKRESIVGLLVYTNRSTF